MEAGAKVGAMAGGAKQRQGRRDQRQATQQQQQTQQQQASAYNNALAACLQARGYSLAVGATRRDASEKAPLSRLRHGGRGPRDRQLRR